MKLCQNLTTRCLELSTIWQTFSQAFSTLDNTENRNFKAKLAFFLPPRWTKLFPVDRIFPGTGEVITAETMSNFIDTLNVSDSVKAELKAITPSSYTGYSESLSKN